MLRPYSLPIALFCCTTVLAGCASGSGAKTAKVIPQPPTAALPPAPAVPAVPDPVVTLMAESDQHFSAGQRDRKSVV